MPNTIFYLFTHRQTSIMAGQIVMNLTCTRLGQADRMIRPIKSCGLAICLFRKDGGKEEREQGGEEGQEWGQIGCCSYK